MTCSDVNTQNGMQIFCVINSEEVGASFCICHALSTNCQIFNEVCKVLHDGELKNCLQTIHKGTHYCVMANCCSLQQIFQSSTLCVTQEGQTLASNSNFLFVSYFVLWCWVVPHPLRISNPPWTMDHGPWSVKVRSTEYLYLYFALVQYAVQLGMFYYVQNVPPKRSSRSIGWEATDYSTGIYFYISTVHVRYSRFWNSRAPMYFPTARKPKTKQ